jgi:hypothetical protein
MLRGRKLPPEVSLVVTPGSRQVLYNIDKDGYLADIIASGARLVEPSCSFCIGNGQAPASGAVSLRSSNRNFEGRSGTADAQVYLVSPETAAASAILGRIASGLDLEAETGLRPPAPRSPERFIVDDGMIVQPLPPSERAGVEIVRGPNIGGPPVTAPLPERLSGTATIKLGDKDHDRPHHARGRADEVPQQYRGLFGLRVRGRGPRSFAAQGGRGARLRDAQRHHRGAVLRPRIVARARGHLPGRPRRAGDHRQVLRAHTQGQPRQLRHPAPRLRERGDYAAVEQGDALEIGDLRSSGRVGRREDTRRDGTKGFEFDALCELTDRQRAIALAGGALASPRRRQMKIQVKTPIAELDGDEMTRVIWAIIKEKLVLPHLDMKLEYYDLGVKERDRTDDAVTVEAANAIARLGVGVKCATITPDAERVGEYGLKKAWPSPNGTLRGILDGTVFRKPIMVKKHQACGALLGEAHRDRPPRLRRPLQGRGLRRPRRGARRARLHARGGMGKPHATRRARFAGPGVIMGMHNTDASIASFAKACFAYALSEKMELWFAAKDTISKTYHARFKDIFAAEAAAQAGALRDAGISYRYLLIDDAVAQVMKHPKAGYCGPARTTTATSSPT